MTNPVHDPDGHLVGGTPSAPSAIAHVSRPISPDVPTLEIIHADNGWIVMPPTCSRDGRGVFEMARVARSPDELEQK